MPGSNESRKKQNDLTAQCATSSQLIWDSSELYYLEEHLEDTTYNTAMELGRTFQAIQKRRQILKLRRKNTNKMPLEERQQKPMTLNEAMQVRTKQIANGASHPTIKSVPGGYAVYESYLPVKEVKK